ncbi:MAG: hypothetical protein A3G59_01115 [Candidatus Taylorbacteria bacterium RIFCSPLOWO2_12_FULL_47_20]|uniref:DNA 3'-5' helicase n=2 Tax=Candidatus Tayloriibacteriota TaxID=1817919 RepID=A0A1G2PAX4_9BACT|nr:MAG: hypothetical protein A3H68_00415 [Candidatus Taylorbacteria bacterium RIFCSPLOWO2_02_FULL_46_40]OHA44751.1 MAG: hypothetical protein A3G59_01115 [Candidatus Taylorbacteria bacterium RIFCSPLOWO2_12_FULL_47_20]
MENGWLENLNPAQKEAALHQNGPLLIVAGAGAGKTRVITHRILNLMKNGVLPEKILAITFTNKAAGEMKRRILSMMGDNSSFNLPVYQTQKPFMSTFHSLCVHILRHSGSAIGIPKSFTIFDHADSKSALREAIELRGLNPKQYDPGMFLHKISRKKADGITAEKLAETASDYSDELTVSIWQKYDDILRRDKALDFDDLLVKAVKLLQKNEEARNLYQNAWTHIHIDEYQDTNAIQYKLVRILSGVYGNVCAVGDVDQCIYGFRGASVKNLLNFEKDFKESKVVFLEENYRSTASILEAANQIISKNVIRVPKILRPTIASKEPLAIYAAYDEEDEAQFISGKCRTLIKAGIRPEEIAVLFRANYQSRVLESHFLQNEIPYQLLGTKFFERKEVKDLLSFIRTALNPDSRPDFKRAANAVPRGIGKTTVLKIFAGREGDLTGAAKIKVAEFRKILADIKKLSEKNKCSEVVKFALNASGLQNALKNDGVEGQERLENTHELVSLAAKYDTLDAPAGIDQFLTDAALTSDQDDLDRKNNGVKLMTIHAAKGLEFDYVFICGLEEGLFPHEKMGRDELSKEESEEERRLMYVAITRARKKVFLSYAGVRTVFGLREARLPSQFLTDIDESLLETETGGEGIKTIYL